MNHSLQSIQALRGVAVLLVVLFHASINFRFLNTFASTRAFEFFGFCGVDLFFVISGFVITFSTADKIGKPKAAAAFVAVRWFRIYSTYWVVLPLVALAAAAGIYDIAPNYNFLESALLLPHAAMLLPVAWTLPFELFFYLLFAVAMTTSLPVFRLFLAVWAAVLIAANLWFVAVVQRKGWSDFLFAAYHLEFILGCTVALLVRSRRVADNAWDVWAGGFVLGVTILDAVFRHHIMGAYEELLPRAALYGGGFALLVFGVVRREQHQGLKIPRVLLAVGNGSYSIYLVHLPVFVALIKFRERLYPAMNLHLLGVLMVLTPVALGCLMYRGVEKPLLVWFKTRLRAA